MSPQVRKGERPRPNLAQLAGMGAFGASAGILLAMLAFFFFTKDGAMDGENRAIAWIGVGGMLLALVAVHVMIGKRLIALGKGVRERP